MQLWHKGMLSESFEPVKKARIYHFAERFGLKKLIEKYFIDENKDTEKNLQFEL